MGEEKQSRFFYVIFMLFLAGLALAFVNILKLRNIPRNQGLVSVISDAPVNTLFSNQEEVMPLTRSGAKCLTFNQTFDNLIASSKQVFVTMPAKAAGTSMIDFTKNCVGPFGKFDVSNIPINNPKNLKHALTRNYEMPSLITAHLYTSSAFVRMVQNVPHNSLIIYMHRDETDRLISAIKQVVVTRLCGGMMTPKWAEKITQIQIQIDGLRCILSERDLIDKVIEPREGEIHNGAPDVLSCGFYDTIETNFPRIVFINYKQADKVQKVLAKYHCPELLDSEAVHENVAKDKTIEAFLKLQNGKEVPLSDWLEKKRNMLEYTLDLRAKQTCRGKTLKMQEDLLSCGDELLEITRDTSF